MIRKSINNSEHYKKAILECYKRIENGKSEDEIIKELNSEFIEHETKSIISAINMSRNLSEYRKLKQILKFNLWVLLIFKILFITGILVDNSYDDFFKFVVLILGPVVNILCLFLVYKDRPNAYFLSTIFGAFSLQSSSFIDGLFDFPLFSIIWFLELFGILNLLCMTIIGFTLLFKLPLGALKVKHIINKNFDPANIYLSFKVK